jgi:DNA-binding NtrC family response regulator
LLVEDEFLIRTIVADDLRGRGYRVIEAVNADEALVIIEASLPDLVITDVRMPGSMDGLEMLVIIKKEHPDLPVIVMSGHLEAGLAIADGAAIFISKPFDPDALVDAADSVLAQKR